MWSQLAAERTDLSDADLAQLRAILREWTLLADLSMADLVLWLPTWNDGGLVAVAQVRPTTAPTNVPTDVVGRFLPRGRQADLEQALALRRTVGSAYPVSRDGRAIGVIERHASANPRVTGSLEHEYQRLADELLAMLVAGEFPPPGLRDGSGESPRAGDGLLRLDADGRVAFASPNAMSAVRRLGLATDLVGRDFGSIATRLASKAGPVDDRLASIAAGRADGRVEIASPFATVLVQGIVLRERGVHAGSVRAGSLVLLRDVSDIRERDRALLSKEATIREIHHRVKNNLQTVAALLRLQSRRASSDETRRALTDAQLRVSAIAVVHETLSRETETVVAFDAVVDGIVKLVGDLAPAYAGEREPVRVTRDGTCGALPTEVATPLAMCIGELLQNAIEHAQASTVQVAMSADERRIEVVVTDDGVGLPDGFDLSATGLGLQIVDSLAKGELRGTFDLSSAPDDAAEAAGTRATLTIPVVG